MRMGTIIKHIRETYLRLGEMVAVVGGSRVTDVQEGLVETGSVRLGQSDRQTKHARREEREAIALEAKGHSFALVADDKTRVRRAGPAQRERNEGRKSEQTCCNHFDREY